MPAESVVAQMPNIAVAYCEPEQLQLLVFGLALPLLAEAVEELFGGLK